MGILPPSVGGGPETPDCMSGLDRANMEVGGSCWGWHGHLEALAFQGVRGMGKNSVNEDLGGGFKYFLFSPLFGEDFQFD